MSDPHSPKFIIALCEAATIKPSAPHHNSHHTMKNISRSLYSYFFRYNTYVATLPSNTKAKNQINKK